MVIKYKISKGYYSSFHKNIFDKKRTYSIKNVSGKICVLFAPGRPLFCSFPIVVRTDHISRKLLHCLVEQINIPGRVKVKGRTGFLRVTTTNTYIKYYKEQLVFPGGVIFHKSTKRTRPFSRSYKEFKKCTPKYQTNTSLFQEVRTNSHYYYYANIIFRIYNSLPKNVTIDTRAGMKKIRCS